jgi:hypothetical protein
MSSPVWCLEFGGGSYIFGKLVDPWPNKMCDPRMYLERWKKIIKNLKSK